MTFLAPYVEPIYAAFRIVFGFLFATHGAQKIFGALGGQRVGQDMPLMYAAGWIELVGGLMIALGLFTAIAAFVTSGEMAVAYFYGHALTSGPWPWANQGELAALYCFAFLYMAARGSGPFALDAMRGRRRRLP
jgi:putative oxidoreductase